MIRHLRRRVANLNGENPTATGSAKAFEEALFAGTLPPGSLFRDRTKFNPPSSSTMEVTVNLTLDERAFYDELRRREHRGGRKIYARKA